MANKNIQSCSECFEEYNNNILIENSELALSDITKIIKYSEKLQTMFNVNDNLEDWVKAKLNHACDYVATVRDYLKFYKKEKLDEKWSMKYKRSIDCNNPKGFGQKAHCRARKLRQAGKKTKSKPVTESYKQAIKELLAEYNSSMAMGSLKQINNDAKEIQSILSPKDLIEDWVKAKLNLAGEYLDDVYHHLDHFGPKGRQFDEVKNVMKLNESWKDWVAAGALGLATMGGPSDAIAAAQPTKKTTAPLQLTPVTSKSSKVKEPLKLIPVTRGSSTNTTTSTNASIDQLKLKKDIDVVAATLIGEAGGEGEVGMQAVLNVIMNRSKNDFNNAAKVCLKKWQFSVWNDQRNNINGYIKEKKKHSRWDVALKLIDKARNGTLSDITGGATFYVNPRVEDPDWRKKFKLTRTIGKHEFYHPGKHPTARFYEYFGFNYYFE